MQAAAGELTGPLLFRRKMDRAQASYAEHCKIPGPCFGIKLHDFDFRSWAACLQGPL